jgi:hypothetical protein
MLNTLKYLRHFDPGFPLSENSPEEIITELQKDSPM